MNTISDVLEGRAEWCVVEGDATDFLRSLPDESVNCVVTSPPYWGLRDYGVEGQIGMERTPEEYVARLVAVFSEARRVLREDGVAWINLGDGYYSGNRAGCRKDAHRLERSQLQASNRGNATSVMPNRLPQAGLKDKDLVGMPWRVAFALQADGWWLRSEVTWCKAAPMPESVRDRPTSATEKVFLLTKSKRYAYDADAVKTPARDYNHARDVVGDVASHAPDTRPHRGLRAAGLVRSDKQRGHGRRHAGFNDRWDAMPKAEQQALGANMRNYLLLGPEPCAEAHFAVMPQALVEPCVKAGCPAGGVACDPFAGSGTVGIVARRLARRFVGCDMNPEYMEMARRRIGDVAPLLDAEDSGTNLRDARAGQQPLFAEEAR